MADTFLGTARGRIKMDYDSRGVKQAQADQTSLQAGTQKSDKAVKTLSKGMAIAGVAMVGAFALAVKTSADFEKTISAVGAVSGASAEQLDQMRTKALQLGRDTKFSAAEAAGAMEELAKAGISTTDILGGAADATVALAAAGEIELPRAAEIAANAMNTFNLSAQELPHVADVIAGAANASAISVDEFAMSMQQSGAAAKLAGVGLEDLATAIALMGNAGIKGSDAGTSLKTMLLNLNPTTKKQKDLMKELGIVTETGANRFFDAAGNAKSLADIAEVLQDSLSGMTRQQKLATLETLFGSDAIRAAAIISESGAEGFNKMAESMGKITAADVAAKRMDNLAGSIEQFKGSVETALITAGAPFQEGIRSIVDAATSLVNAFANLSPGAQKLIGQFLAFGGAALLLSAGILRIVHSATTAGSLLNSMGKALVVVAKGFRFAAIAARAFSLALIANPVGLIIAAVIALIAVLVLLFNKNKAFHDFVIRAWEGIKDAFAAVVEFFRGTVLPALSTGWDAIVNAMRSAWESIQPIVQPVMQFIVTTIKNGIAIITGIVKLFAALLTGNWTAAWNAIKQIAGAILNQIGNVIRTIISLILNGWKTWGANMLSALLSWVGGVLAAIGRFAAQLPSRILFAIGFIIGRWIRFQVQMIAGAVRLGLQVLAAIIRFFSQVPTRVGSYIARTLTAFVSWATRMISQARSAGARVLSAIISFFSQLPSRIGSFLASAITRMVSFAQRLPQLARQAASAVIRAISSGLSSLPGIVSGVVDRAISAFTGLISRAFSAAKSLASSLWNGFKSGLGIGSPSLIERAMVDLNDSMRREIKRFGKRGVQLARVAAKLPDIMPTSADLTANVAAMPAAAGGGVILNFDLRGGTWAPGAAAEVRQAFSNDSILGPINQAIRASGR